MSQPESLDPAVSRPRVREQLAQRLPTIEEFDAFCLDYFPAVKARFTGGMERRARETLLLETQDPAEVLAALQRYSEQRSCVSAPAQQDLPILPMAPNVKKKRWLPISIGTAVVLGLSGIWWTKSSPKTESAVDASSINRIRRGEPYRISFSDCSSSLLTQVNCKKDHCGKYIKANGKFAAWGWSRVRNGIDGGEEYSDEAEDEINFWNVRFRVDEHRNLYLRCEEFCNDNQYVGKLEFIHSCDKNTPKSFAR